MTIHLSVFFFLTTIPMEYTSVFQFKEALAGCSNFFPGEYGCADISLSTICHRTRNFAVYIMEGRLCLVLIRPCTAERRGYKGVRS